MTKLKILSLFQFSIRVKLLLASTVLLIIPTIGFQYIKELETFLREDQQQRLLENARVLSLVISAQPQLDSFFKKNVVDENNQHIFVRPLVSNILLDGFSDDWQFDPIGLKVFDHLSSPPNNNGEVEKDPPSYEFLLGHRSPSLYAFFKIKDKKLTYQGTEKNLDMRSDHIRISIENSAEKLSQYIISTHSPGAIQARKMIRRSKKKVDYEPFPRIKAVWQETTQGYNVEIQIPQSILGEKISFAVIDIDDQAHPERATILYTAKTVENHQLNSISVPDARLQRLIDQFAFPESRTWVINSRKNVIAASGNIFGEEKDVSEFDNPDNFNVNIVQFFQGIMRLVYQAMLPQPSERFYDESNAASTLVGGDIELALSGQQSTQWRLTKSNDVNILRAVYPIYSDSQDSNSKASNSKVMGAVAVERNSNSILILQNRAVEILMNTSILIFVLSTVLLLSFASRLSYRIRRLRDDTENAISADGRIRADKISDYKNTKASADEIGDLQRSYTSMLVRLADYNRYLESMASKLSHELRTPITVVKSSLENIENNLQDQSNDIFLERAKDGVDRLNDILTRMSEATRLEQSLRAEKKQKINISKIVSGCTEGYKIAHGAENLQLYIQAMSTDGDIYIQGCADLIAQLLDKLVSNALDFSDKRTPVTIILIEEPANIILSVANSGSRLPEYMQSNLFESMVSVREKRSEQPHLGLGLYIVRLIADFHCAKPFARNFYPGENLKSFCGEKTQDLSVPQKNDCQGVVVGIEFPHLSGG